MIAIPKHFAGHGQPMGGRDSQDIGLSDRTMREIHLPSAPTLQHGHYPMDDLVVTQECLSPELVVLLFHDGYGALLHGSYTSARRPYASVIQSLDAVTRPRCPQAANSL
jgi:hypothetical protein